jgi:hypothetical protein
VGTGLAVATALALVDRLVAQAMALATDAFDDDGAMADLRQVATDGN